MGAKPQSLPALTSPARLIGGVAALAAASLVLSTGPQDLPLRVGAISLVAILFFALRVVPEMLTSLWCILAFLAIDAAPAQVIFSGFATGGLWLMFSGLIIGTAITQTGLGQWLAHRIFRRVGASYARAIWMLAGTGLLLGVLIPSTIPRIIVLVPIAASLAEVMGHRPGSRGHVGLTVTAAAATLLPTYAILTANLPTIIHYGALETLYDLHPSYATYFLYQFPVNAVRMVLILALLLPLARQVATGGPVETGPVEPMRPVQRRLLAVLGGAIVLWATDTMHGISPAWIALGVASLALLPATGFLKTSAMKADIDLSPTVFLAGVFAISAVFTHIGLDAELSDAVLPRLRLGEGSGLWDLYAITGFSALASHLTTAPAAPIILAPLAAPMAEAAGWPVLTVAMAQVIGIATPLLPYQAPPLIVAMALVNMPARTITRLCLGIAAGVLLVGIPLTYGWWLLIGAV